jgi:hypothetical protein
MRNLVILFVSMLISILSFSQKMEDYNLTLGSYTIKLLQNSDNTYGYEITKDAKTVVIQKIKPFQMASKGFVQMQNAIASALWAVKNVKEGKDKIQTMSVLAAKELGITKDDLDE